MTMDIRFDGAAWFTGRFRGVRAGLSVGSDGPRWTGQACGRLNDAGLPLDLPGPGPWLFLIPFEASQLLEDLPRREPWWGALDRTLFWQPLSWTAGEESGQVYGEDLSRPFLEQALGQGERGFQDLPQGIQSSFSRDQYLQGVERLLQANRRGDVYQGNLSQTFLSPGGPSAEEAYEQLCEGPVRPDYASLWNLGEAGTMLCWSPERLLRCAGRSLQTDPIAGTRRTDPDTEVDRQMIDELHLSAKEQAEHAMLVDLLRNDLGRVAQPGSVHVPSLARVESHGYVHHIVSTVAGELAADATPLEALWALFPGGTISGVPKISALKHLQQLETFSRGIYTGTAGIYWPERGLLEANILIRSFHFHKRGVVYGAGGGIVTESLPESEYQESLAKAAPLFGLVGAGEETP